MAAFNAGNLKGMTSFHKKVLTKVHPLLMETMVFSNGLRSRLIADEVLSYNEARDIRDKGGNDAQNSWLLDILQRKPDHAYGSLVKALESADQPHVAEIIRKKEAELEQEDKAKGSREPVVGLPVKPELHREEISNPNSPGPRMICDGPSPNENNAVALPGQPVTPKEVKFQLRRQEKREGRTTDAQQSSLIGEGCMIGIKLFIREVCTNDNEWFIPDESLRKDVEKYIWRTLSQVLTKPLPEEIAPEIDSREESRILRCLFNFQKYCNVKHVGFEPVLFVVQCMTANSLYQLSKGNEDGTFAQELENAMRTESLSRRLNIKEFMLETDISELEIKLGSRILNERVATLDVKIQSAPERHVQLEYEWWEKVQTNRLANGTAINTAVKGFSAEVKAIKQSSVLFTLQFRSKENLNIFRRNLDSGLLVRLFETALVTDEVKQKYGLDTVGLSVTVVDPWEYEMCEMELELATFEQGHGHSSVNETAEDRSFEGKYLEQHSHCCEHIQKIELLEETIRKLKETCDSDVTQKIEFEKNIRELENAVGVLREENKDLKNQNRILRKVRLEDRDRISGSCLSVDSAYCEDGGLYSPLSFSAPALFSREADGSNPSPSLESQAWYHPGLDRVSAESWLSPEATGTFLLRQQKDSQNYVISIRTNTKVIHVRVRGLEDGKYDVEGYLFESVLVAIDHLMKKNLRSRGEDVKLSKPFARKFVQNKCEREGERDLLV